MNDIIPGDYDGMHGGEPRRAHDNPILMLHRHLRGRYRWVAIVGLLLAVPLAVGGYLAVKPTYTSTGMIRIAPTMTMIIYNDLEDAKVPAMFESMVSTQAALLQSRRVLDLAMDDPKLRAAGWPAAPEGLALLQKNLDVSNRRALELISASVKSPDGALAQAAVNAILTAYEKVYDDNNSFNYASRTQAIEQQRDKLATEIESARRTIRELAKKYATDELDGLHSEKIIEIEKLNQDIKNLEMALVNRTKNAESAPEAGGIPDELKDSIPVLAQEDAVLSRLLEDERNIQTSIDALLRKATKEHRDYKSLNDRLLSVREQIEARADELRRVPRVNEASRPNLVATMTTEAIQERLTSYKALVKQRLAEANELQDTKLAISAQRAIVADRQKDFDQVSQTLEQIRFESRAYSMGRVSVLQKGDLPVEPSTDRRAALAGLGAFAGFGLGGCIVLFVGIARGGYRFIEDVEREDAAVPLLGTIPDLADGGVEQEQMAALSVHHLRNMLQLQFEAQPGGKVYTITSASSGDGKTSLAIALAMSFAATGRRTIIVDTDLVGRGLTRQLELQGQTGLCEALQHDKLNGEVKETKVQSLWALPSGVLGSFVPEHLSSSMMKKLIGRLRDQYDAVILDTGPILGSLEANVVAPASDGCVLVVTRGQNAKMVRASIGRLRRLGATCSGLIFNRAGTRDFQRSVSTASVSARSIQANTPAARAQNPGGRAALLRALEAPANENAPHSS